MSKKARNGHGGARTGAGRPSDGRVSLTIRVSAATLARLARLAQRSGLSVSKTAARLLELEAIK